MATPNDSATVNGNVIATHLVSSKEYQVVMVTDSTGVLDTAIPIKDGGNSITVDDGGGSLTVDGSVSITGAIPAGTNNIGDVDVLTMPVVQVGDNGGSLTVDGSVSLAAAIPAGTNNIGDVDVLTMPTVSVKPYAVAAADILSGSTTVTNSTTETTIITIPAGRTWVGRVNVGTVWTGVASTALKFAHIRTLGTGVTPSAGTVLCRVDTTTGDNNLSGQIAVTAPGGNSVTITVTSGGATTQVSTGSAWGVLL